MSLFSRLAGSAAESVDHRIRWDRLPKPLAHADAGRIRDRLRAKNLYDTGRGPPICRRARRTTRVISRRGRSTAPTTTSTTR